MKLFQSIPVFVFLILLFVSNFGYAQNYDEKRKEIVDKQKDTREEINLLEQKIRRYQERINETEKR